MSKERYELRIYAGCECYSITDTKGKQQLSVENAVNLLHKYDQQIAELKAKNNQLQQQLKDNTKQVYEEIIDIIDKEFNCCGYIEDIKFDEFKQKLLDQIKKGEVNG